jgi:hypothetical protein
MKKIKSIGKAWAFLLVLSASFIACKKDQSLAPAIAGDQSSNTIAVLAELTQVAQAAGDSVYIVHPCGRGSRRDTIAQSALPASVASYVSANYSGSVFHKAFAITNSSAATEGYVVVIYYNAKPVALQFDSAGTFIKVLEQRERGDLDGAGWHRGGRFRDRSKQQNDTIALNALPAAVSAYFTLNYPLDTLVKAFRNRDSSIVLLSKNAGVFATVFNASNAFVSHVQLPSKAGKCQVIDQSALPSNALSYLNTTYPNYVFKKAFSVSNNGAVRGYVVVIDANNTKYAIEFDASGNFARLKPIH